MLERTIGRLFYHPTFRGEAYSLAAALGALAVYDRLDVPGHVHAFGTLLKDGVNRLSRELGVAAAEAFASLARDSKAGRLPGL